MNCVQCSAAVPAGAKFCVQCGAPVIQIPKEIADRASGFTGRAWVLEQVSQWWAVGQERFMFISGEPGCGKTALAAWLAGAGPTPEDGETFQHLAQIRQAWRGAHFCIADDKRGTLDPVNFAQSLALQLSRHYDDFTEAMLHRLGAEFNIHQHSRENRGRMVAVQIENFTLNTDLEDAYSRLVREPLKAIGDYQPNLEMLILVDALDEALTYGRKNIVTLLKGSDDLPPGVRFVLTSRNEAKVLDQFRVKRRVDLSDPQYAGDADTDVRGYVARRLGEAPIRAHVEAVGAPSDIADKLVERAAGNFLYIHLLFKDVLENNRSLADPTGLPRGLYAYYRTYLDRLLPEMLEAGASRPWQDEIQPLLGCLSVAMPSAPREALYEWLGDVAAGRLNDLSQVVERDPGPPSGYRLYHRSMADFLTNPTYKENGAEVGNRYHTHPRTGHQRIMDYYLPDFQEDWAACDAYGLRRLVAHMQARLELERKPKAKREQTKALYSVVLDATFRQAQLKVLGDNSTTLADLRTALEIALERDDWGTALACIGAHRGSIRSAGRADSDDGDGPLRPVDPQAVFGAVNAKPQDLTQALARAAAFEAVPDWGRVLHLYLAWEAAQAGDADTTIRAVEAANRLPTLYRDEICDALLAHTARALARTVEGPRDASGWFAELAPSANLQWSLEPFDTAQAPDPIEREALVDQLRDKVMELQRWVDEGDVEAVSMVPFVDAEELSFRSAGLKDLLIRLAADEEGQRGIDQVLAPLLTHPYPHYRDISLEALGVATLAVPATVWARERLQLIIRAALQEGITYTFDLPTILLAEAQRRNLPAAELNAYVQQVLGIEDSWGTRIRAFSARAAATFYQRLPDDAFNVLQEIEETVKVRPGYAGFAVLTLLSLANRKLSFGLPQYDAQIIDLLNGAAFQAQLVRAPDLRAARQALVDAFQGWLAHDTPDAAAALETLQTLADPYARLAYIDHVSARWAYPTDGPNWEGLKALLPLALADATTLDALLGRILGLQVQQLSDEELDAAVSVCAADLATSRPWRLGQWQ